MRTYSLAFLLSLTLCAATLASGAYVDRALGARAVSLSDAATMPTVEHALRAHRSVSVPLWCAFNLTDVSAYYWDGSALGAQRWTSDHTVTYWRAKRGRVTFDGLTFRNRTRATVLVAVWCAR